MTAPNSSPERHDTGPAPLSVIAIALMRGAVYRDQHELPWRHLLSLRHAVGDHFAVLGLQVMIDEAEGYAYLTSLPDDPDAPLPRLIPRHRLSYPVSLLLALVRKAVAEFDATSGEGRLVLTRSRLVEDLRTFLGDSTNEAKIVDQVDRTIAKVADLGFLRPMPSTPPSWEVRRIIKAFIDAQWLAEFDQRLAEYAAVGRTDETGDDA